MWGVKNFKSEAAKAILKVFGPQVEIYNEYGPTEATVGCVMHKIDEGDLNKSSLPIGKPISNMQVYLLDEYLNPVPQGVPGELCLSGSGLASGYWNNPAMSDEKFTTCPFSLKKKMYRSGDIARFNSNGNLEYLGRKDKQVKIAGVRVELGEIEAAINTHEGINHCVVNLQQRNDKPQDEPVLNCQECGLPSNYPSSDFDENGICNLCRSFESYQRNAAQYFKKQHELETIFKQANEHKKGDYDCIMLLSGGKDSTYALANLVDMGLRVLGFTLDNGYISDQAKANIRRVVNALGVDHVFGETSAMNAIFVDSLNRHCNVCNGCFKTIYTLSTKLALEKGIPIIVTGLSRGQFFETRLTEELFNSEQVEFDRIDQTILEARKAYHRTDDAVNQLLDVSFFSDDEVFDKVQFVDFYRFCDVSLDQMLSYLEQQLPWIRPTDTGRSTNCLINQVGIYVHKQKRGYSNYAFPYSWDVRLGHKTRDASIEEVNEEIDEKSVSRIMTEIGYHPNESNPETQHLVAYYVSDSKVSQTELRQHLSNKLPDYMIPAHFREIAEIPLTTNGKIDFKSLPGMDDGRPDIEVVYVAPGTEIQILLAEIWSEVLQIPKIGGQR